MFVSCRRAWGTAHADQPRWPLTQIRGASPVLHRHCEPVRAWQAPGDFYRPEPATRRLPRRLSAPRNDAVTCALFLLFYLRDICPDRRGQCHPPYRRLSHILPAGKGDELQAPFLIARHHLPAEMLHLCEDLVRLGEPFSRLGIIGDSPEFFHEVGREQIGH